MGEIISGWKMPLNFMSGPSAQSRDTTIWFKWIDLKFIHQYPSIKEPVTSQLLIRECLVIYWTNCVNDPRRPMLVLPMTSGATGCLVLSWTSSSREAGHTQVILSPRKVKVCGFAVSAISWGAF